MKYGQDHSKLRLEIAPKQSPELLEVLELIEQRTQKNPWNVQSLCECFADPYKLLVLFYVDQVIGFAVIYNTKFSTDLLTIGIDPEYQGRGFGRYLLENTLKDALAGGATECFLEVRFSNLRAISLYESVGFVKAGVRKNYYQASGNVPAEHAYTMHLENISSCLNVADKRRKSLLTFQSSE